jgi:hypothetical protein
MEDVFQLCLFVVKEIASGTPLAFQVNRIPGFVRDDRAEGLIP